MRLLTLVVFKHIFTKLRLKFDIIYKFNLILCGYFVNVTKSCIEMSASKYILISFTFLQILSQCLRLPLFFSNFVLSNIISDI